jgi:hypothetical protein
MERLYGFRMRWVISQRAVPPDSIVLHTPIIDERSTNLTSVQKEVLSEQLDLKVIM